MANNNRTTTAGGTGYNGKQKSRPQIPVNRTPQGYPRGRQPQSNADPYLRRIQENVGKEPRQMHIPIPPPEYQHKQNNGCNYRKTASAQRNATRQRANEIQRQMGTKPNPARRVNGYAMPGQQKSAMEQTASRRTQTGTASRWAMPEGSAVYTSNGVYYNGKKEADRAARSKNRLAAEKKAEKARIKAEKRKKFKLYSKTFFVTLGIVFILCCAIMGIIYRSTFTSSGDSTGSIDYTLITEKNHYLSGDGNCYSDGIAYIDFSEFAQYFGMASVGSVDSMRFIIPDEKSPDSSGTGHEEYVIFTNGVRCATVNGTDVIMEGPVRTSGLSVRVPFSFVENYIHGLTFEKSANGSDVTVSPEKKEKNKDEKLIPEIGFSIRKPDALSHVSYPS